MVITFPIFWFPILETINLNGAFSAGVYILFTIFFLLVSDVFPYWKESASLTWQYEYLEHVFGTVSLTYLVWAKQYECTEYAFG